MKKISKAKGYQVKYGTSKSLKKGRTVNVNAAKAKIKGLKSKKTYFFKVRAYVITNKVRKYGKWSSTKTKKL